MLGGATVDSHAGAFGLRNFLAATDALADERGGRLLDAFASIAQLPIWAFAIGALALLATFAQRRFDPILNLALWIATYFLVYTDVWEHHYVMLLPALVLLVMLRPRFAPLALATFVLVALPTPYWLFERLSGDPNEVRDVLYSDPQHAWSSAEILANHLSKALPTLVLWSGLVYAALRDVDWTQLRVHPFATLFAAPVLAGED